MANKKLKRVETLEDEFKLIKGELKESLASVRDYLLSNKLPPSEYAAILADVGVGAGQVVEMKANLVMDSSALSGASPAVEDPEAMNVKEAPVEEAEAVESEEMVEIPETTAGRGSDGMSEGYADHDTGAEESPAGEGQHGAGGAAEYLDPAEEVMEYPAEEAVPFNGYARAEYPPATVDLAQPMMPPVNLLANLFRWVSTAKKSIGPEQLPVFLEVYGLSGHLSPELKEAIIHLADIPVEQAAESVADTWSQLTLELHGILVGSLAPTNPIQPFWREPEPVEAEPVPAIQEQKSFAPTKVKLVFPDGDGTEREVTVELNPEDTSK